MKSFYRKVVCAIIVAVITIIFACVKKESKRNATHKATLVSLKSALAATN